ncbi:MAG: TlpA family protein disulfide reductase [Pseudomonadales bacterium]|nr:TlpA family protein disulfide reductase [Pseudomonadales bacterium]
MLMLCTLIVGCEQPAPDFLDTDGNGIYLAELNKKFLVVNYWATWCGPCIKEIPELNELGVQQATSLNLFGVNFDAPDAVVMARDIKKMKIQFPVFATPVEEKLNVLLPEVLPTTYIFGPGGAIVATLVGPQTEASILLAMGIED